MGNRYKREINMNGKNKRWLEQRWDMNQPARMAAHPPEEGEEKGEHGTDL